MTAAAPVRDAATIIVLRDRASAPAVLMGQRGASAAFMPGKFVFPGGAIDANDAKVPTSPLAAICADRLAEGAPPAPQAIAAAAIRELWEETGQILGQPHDWPDAPAGWRGFAKTGHIPHAAALTFYFRAVTPKGASRRFDARFLLADAADLCTDPDDFSQAEDELSHLQWVPLDQARHLDLPFITQVVLAELVAQLPNIGPPDTVPFFANNDELHLVRRLGGKSLL